MLCRACIVRQPFALYCRQICLPLAQSMTSVSRLAAAKEDMSTDIQEDSSADKGALKESREVAKEAENVQEPNNYTPRDAEGKAQGRES